MFFFKKGTLFIIVSVTLINNNNNDLDSYFILSLYNDKDAILPLKLMLIVKYLNANDMASVDDLLEEIKVVHSSNENKDEELFLEDCLFKEMPKEAKRVFEYCSFLEPTFIPFKLLDRLLTKGMKDERKELQSAVNFLERRGLLIKTDYKNYEEGCSITHMHLQKEMRQRMSRQRNGELLAKIGKCLAESVLACDRNVTRKRDEKRVDVDFKQVKHVVAQLEDRTVSPLSQSEFRDSLIELNEKLGYYYFFYDVSYEKALACFEKVNVAINKESERDLDNLNLKIKYQ